MKETKVARKFIRCVLLWFMLRVFVPLFSMRLVPQHADRQKTALPTDDLLIVDIPLALHTNRTVRCGRLNTGQEKTPRPDASQILWRGIQGKLRHLLL